MEKNKNELVLFESQDKGIKLSVPFNNETVWLSSNQMAELFERDEKTIRKHVNNVFTEKEVEVENNTQNLRVVNVKQPVTFYSLDVIISVGYRVKSKRGTEFRRWANTVLKQYILNGYAANEDRLFQLNKAIQLIKRLELQTENQLDKTQILSVVESYTQALNLLDDYDHQKVNKPEGNSTTYVLSYEECRSVIDQMRFASESNLSENGIKRISDNTLVALTIMIAESKPDEKELMVNLVMNFLK